MKNPKFGKIRHFLLINPKYEAQERLRSDRVHGQFKKQIYALALQHITHPEHGTRLNPQYPVRGFVKYWFRGQLVDPKNLDVLYEKL